MLSLIILLACSGDKTPTDGADDSAATDDSASADDSQPTGWSPSHGAYFPPEATWYQDVSAQTPDPSSEAVIAWLDDHGWGLGRFQLDASIEVLDGEADAPFLPFTATGDFYSPDCDQVEVPVPEGGAIEGESGYACESDGDCHLIVAHWPTGQLFEMWRADIRGDTFRGGCLAVWDMNRVYGPEGRGQQCTSADAAGYPIAPLLFSADEVAAGSIDHAVRFVLPNSAIRAAEYVSPATHSTGAASGGPDAPPYGAHLRLRADFPLDSLPNEASRVVARALQTYGMFLSDGGNVALTARSDRFTEAKWEGLLGSRDLEDIRPSDFELMPMGTPIELTYDCQRVD